jgi:hypothetical protein
VVSFGQHEAGAAQKETGGRYTAGAVGRHGSIVQAKENPTKLIRARAAPLRWVIPITLWVFISGHTYIIGIFMRVADLLQNFSGHG